MAVWWVCVAMVAAGVDEAPEVQAAIDAAIAGGQREVVLEPRVYRLGATLVVDKADGFTLRGDGTTLLGTRTDLGLLRVRRSKNVTFRGLTIDYDPLPFTQGTVTAVAADRTSLEFVVHEGYPSLTPEYLQQRMYVFEADQPRWKAGAPDIYPRRVEAVDPRHGWALLNPAAPGLAAVAVGDRVVLNQRNAPVVRIDDSEGLRVEGLTFLAGPGAAVIVRYVWGENPFSYDIRPGPPPPGATQPRLMSTCADGFNYAFARTGPVLEKCRFSFMGDDSVNLHGLYFTVVEAVSPTELLLGRPYRGEPLARLMHPGDVLRRLAPDDYRVLGEAPVAEVTPGVTGTEAQHQLIRRCWSQVQPKDAIIWRVKLREPLPVEVGDGLDAPDTAAPGFRIADCEFSDHRARGLRIMSPRGVIERNVLRRLQQVGIYLGSEYAFWREAGWVHDVTVRGNRLEDIGRGPETWGPSSYALGAITVGGRWEQGTAPPERGNRDLVIEDNVVDGCSVAGIWARAAERVTARGNRIRNVSRVTAPDAGAKMKLSCTGAVDLRGVGGAVAD